MIDGDVQNGRGSRGCEDCPGRSVCPCEQEKKAMPHLQVAAGISLACALVLATVRGCDSTPATQQSPDQPPVPAPTVPTIEGRPEFEEKPENLRPAMEDWGDVWYTA